ncbi:YagE family protein [Coprinopsis cinerea okayama7|uniref:YagE family protein n=1 Tax=Coprinopsis cinerea (strain Okayama-7 / 130 / ATCC MYA-4618 / FGSC 9003) TaxID=240176 RepID=A8NCJ5_COPC7|nr:YagE family protein [Coprinopsis cinerea okayama7\|eukprot:XP_001832539.2 YagE family protein [Coprinopsis cinerea okayama7\
MAPLPKPKRTTKTSQKLVVLPSAPQTKPLLDEEPETSDEEALPRVAITRSRLPHPLPPRVPTKGRIERAHMERAARGTEEVGSEEEGKGRAVEEPRPMKRVREYKSAAERMTKEERKKAGLKRITAYCVAEGLRMKSLAGFLKREHNVQPRIFDEALYAMYHLPLLPGYGPQINVRSGAAPSILKESSPLNRQKDLLGALEETEEDGYHDPYFQSQQHGSNLEMHHSERPLHSLSDTQLITTDATDGPGDLGSTLPGLVRPASVEEVRGADGYVTSDSFAPVDPSSYESTAHLEAEMLKKQSSSRFDQSASTFQPEYNPYPSSSEASSPKTLRELSGPFHSELGGGGENVTQVILPTSESFVEAAAASRGQLDDHLEGDRSIAASDETSLHNPTVDTSLSSSALDSGLETDDPGAFTDPGVYGPWPRNPKSGLSSSNEERGSRLNMAATTSTGTQTDTDGATTEADGEDSGQLHGDRPVTESTLTETGSVTAGQATSDLLRPLQKDGSGSGSDVTATAVLAKSDGQSPESTQVHTSNNVTAVNSSSSGDNSQTADKHGGVLSAYETQMAYDREREDAEYQFEQERERARQLEYERALERERERERERELDNVAEVVFFEYGVVVFFGLDERGERDILDDLEQAGAYRRLMKEDDWEIEECHFAHDPQIAYPRIYNDFFTLKSRSHLLKLAIAHGLAQSTLLARYEAVTAETLTSPMALSIPRQMAESGSLQLRRHDALKLTGRLFKLRRDVNLVSNVLDIPELFWSESSLKELYDAVRDYMEIDPRVDNLNERLGVASDFVSTYLLLPCIFLSTLSTS